MAPYVLIFAVEASLERLPNLQRTVIAETMPSALRIILTQPPIRLAVMAMMIYALTMAATLPLQSVIGVKELGMGDQKFALFMFAAAVVNVLVALALGALSDGLRNPKGLIMLLASAGFVGYGLIYALPSQLAFILCMLTLIPFGRSVHILIMANMRRDMQGLPAQAMTSVNSTARALYALGWVVTPGLIGVWLSGASSMLPAFLVASLASLAVVAVYGFLARSRTTEPAPAITFFSAVKLLADRKVMALVLAMAAGSGAHTLHSTLHPLVMTGPAGGTLADVGLYAGLLAGLEIPFMLLWAHLSSHWGISRTMATALAVYAGYAVLMAFASAPWHLYAIAVLNSAGAAAVLSLPVSAFQDLFKTRPGLGTSLLPAMNFLGAVMGSAGFALGTWAGGYSVTAFVIAALCLAGAASLIALERQGPETA